jgi:hypothetical protein
MSLSTESTEGGAAQPDAAQAGVSVGGSLLTGSADVRCTVCNAKMAVDQRYCVQCGTRRGNQRFLIAQEAPETTSAAGSAGGVATAPITRLQLLLVLLMVLVAIGVGVLIGHGTAKTPQVNIAGGSVSSTNTHKSGSGSGSPSRNSGSSTSTSPFTNGG